MRCKRVCAAGSHNLVPGKLPKGGHYSYLRKTKPIPSKRQKKFTATTRSLSPSHFISLSSRNLNVSFLSSFCIFLYSPICSSTIATITLSEILTCRLPQYQELSLQQIVLCRIYLNKQRHIRTRIHRRIAFYETAANRMLVLLLFIIMLCFS